MCAKKGRRRRRGRVVRARNLETETNAVSANVDHANLANGARADGEAATASSWPLFGTAGAVLALALVATVLVLPQRLRHPLRRALLADDEGEYQLAE